MTLTMEALTDLYQSDETAWLDTMAELIAEGKHQDLDYAHLQEFLADMAKRDRREVESRLVVLLAHLLKWTHQKKKRTGSWQATVFVQSRDLARMLDSRTLAKHAQEVLADVYKDAVKAAAAETGLADTSFSKKCPWTIDDLLAEDLLEDRGE
jgi:uncharacterized protein DUF29